MRILVTGATGFIGKNLVKELTKKKYDVICIVRKSSNKKDIDFLKCLGCEIYYGDITQKETLKKLDKSFDIVYHLAGVLGGAYINEKEYYLINVEGTKNILEICSNQKFIFLSSAGVLGPIVCGDEKANLNPTNLYEKTKADAEKLVSKYDNYIILRTEFVYGLHDNHVLNLFKFIKLGRFRVIGKGKSMLHPTYIDDLTSCLIKCIDKKIINEVFIIAGEKPVSVEEFYKLVSKELQVKANKFRIPFVLAKSYVIITSRLSEKLKINPILTKSRLDFFTRSRAFNTYKAKKMLKFMPIKLEEGVKKTIKWYKKNGYL